MANWCNNTVVFEGKPEAIEQIQKLFKSMAEQEQNEGCGQLPDFVEDNNGGYFFDIYLDNEDTDVFQYQTKWSPNTEAIKQIAEYYNVDFIQDYEELGNCVYGKADYTNGLLTDIYLEDEDFEQYEYDEETDTYLFQRTRYACEWDILETLLECKIETYFNNIRNQNNETIR